MNLKSLVKDQDFNGSNAKSLNVKDLTDRQLHQNLLILKSKESRIVAHIISHLEEVYRRRLFASYKCSSIYDYCIRILGYSNGEAHKKISACKLASHCEGVKESIASGELSLSNAASIQVFLNQSAKLKRAKNQVPKRSKASNDNRELNNQANQSLSSDSLSGNLELIVERIKNKSTRECEMELEKIARENHLIFPEKKPSKRHYGEKTLLKVYLDREKLQLLKSRLNINCEQEMLKKLIDEKLEMTETRTEIKPKLRARLSKRPRSISPAKRAAVFKKAQSQCVNCGSRHHLQVDHKLSVAKGGGNEIENLRVLCRSCNQRAAINQLGFGKMENYLNKNLTPSEGQVALNI